MRYELRILKFKTGDSLSHGGPIYYGGWYETEAELMRAATNARDALELRLQAELRRRNPGPKPWWGVQYPPPIRIMKAEGPGVQIILDETPEDNLLGPVGE